VVDVGKLQETVMTWTPGAWLNTMRAFRPLARKSSYSTEKSAVVTAGCGVGLAGSSTLAHRPPLTTLAHMAVGETKEVGGARRNVGQLAPSLPGWLPYDPSGGGGRVAEGVVS
jgi:hypothetical protein